MKLDRVTITGADDQTSIAAMKELSARYPFVEWGILMSPKQEGGPRFPSAKWIDSFAHQAWTERMKISLHLCGGYVRDFVRGENSSFADHSGAWTATERIQLNFHAEPHDFDLDSMVELMHLHHWGHQYIFQMDGTDNELMLLNVLGKGVNAVPLFDRSGGAGQVPVKWLEAATMACGRPSYHGYAGGLGPDNITEQLPLIAEAAGETLFWIDMESRVRTDEVLDLAKVEQVLMAVQAVS